MTRQPPSATVPRSGSAAVANRLRLAGLGAMVLMPLAMWLANRSAPLMLGLAAAALLAAAVVAEPAAALAPRVRRLLKSPLAFAVLAFLAFALLSIAWSHDRGASIQAFGELVLPVLLTAAIAASGQWRPSRSALRALALAIILAAVLVMVELASGMAQRAALGTGKLMGFVFNRPAIVLLLLAVPAVHALWTRPAGLLDRALAAGLAAVVIVFVFRSESEAAKLGVLALVPCWALAVFAPRLALAATALAFVATMAIAPMLGPMAERLVPAALLNRLDVMSAQARIDIWGSFGEVARARAIAGAGFGTSPTMQHHPVADAVTPERRLLLGVGHPHDMPLQAWAETGAVGAGFMSAAGLLLLAGLRRLRPAEMAPRLALFAAAFSIAAVGHGAWQGWWIAALGAAILWFGSDAETSPGESHG